MNYEIKCGNCFNELPKIIEKLEIRNKKYILVSDPPYNIGYHYNNYSDKMSEEDYFNMLQFIFENEVHVLIHYPEVLHKHSFIIGDFPERVVSWVYPSNTPRQHRDIAFYGVKPDFKRVGQPYKNPNDKRIQERIKEGKTARLYDWWEVNQVKNVSKDKTEHPCQMPIEVMDRIIGILPDNVVIIDPFMGSGSTGVACVHFNKDFIGIEIDEGYCKIADMRIKKEMSQKRLMQER